ncbi:aspartyl protease family protein [Bacillus sp. DJP31]|uniref:aspartyl protease family protein n=1 Tax=Bacillus sp. DJP31 TaxID=3409789 RepID=UPI003BB4A342
MRIRVENGLPIASVRIEYAGESKMFNNVLVDTGCAVTIFDTDLMDEIGLTIDFVHGVATTMYGVGGKGEVCNQQKVNGLSVDGQLLSDFNIQLGMIQDMYGFNGLLGFDFMLKTGLIIDFNLLETQYK